MVILATVVEDDGMKFLHPLVYRNEAEAKKAFEAFMTDEGASGTPQDELDEMWEEFTEDGSMWVGEGLTIYYTPDVEVFGRFSPSQLELL